MNYRFLSLGGRNRFSRRLCRHWRRRRRGGCSYDLRRRRGLFYRCLTRRLLGRWFNGGHGLFEATGHWWLNRRRGRAYELTEFGKFCENDFTFDSELFCELVDPDLRHNSPVLRSEQISNRQCVANLLMAGNSCVAHLGCALRDVTVGLRGVGGMHTPVRRG